VGRHQKTTNQAWVMFTKKVDRESLKWGEGGVQVNKPKSLAIGVGGGRTRKAKRLRWKSGKSRCKTGGTLNRGEPPRRNTRAGAAEEDHNPIIKKSNGGKHGGTGNRKWGGWGGRETCGPENPDTEGGTPYQSAGKSELPKGTGGHHVPMAG